MFVARLGLRVGKWVTNAGSFLTVLIIALLAVMPSRKHSAAASLGLVLRGSSFRWRSSFFSLTTSLPFSLNFTANSRLPMVAGWDHLLPEWFTRLHVKYRTPVNSIHFLGGITIATSVVILAGVGDQEAFELLQILGFTFYGLAYLALFAIPLLARKEHGIRPGLWLRFAAASGFLVPCFSFFSRSFQSFR
jgi:amino acid transporter